MKRGIAFLLVTLFVIIAIFFIWHVKDNNYEKQNYQGEKAGNLEEVMSDEEQTITTDYNCEENKIKFDYPPVNLDKTLVFLPMGLMTDSHVTPIDHHYFQNFDNTKPDIEVYSPGEGIITEIQHMPNAKEGEDYRLVIEHSCNVSSIYIHIYFLSEKIKNHIGEKDYISVQIPVEAGEIIGYYEKNVDYNLVYEGVVLDGFIVPEHYSGEPWKIHVPTNTYDYFNEPVKSKLIEKSLRTAEPMSGKIDYDIDGRLSGNWFLEGTDGYSGGGNREKYWINHLAIAYDAYDPDRIVFSIAGYDERDSRQFAVKGNAPDPSVVSIEDGVIKYELVEYYYITIEGNSWDMKSLVKGIKTETRDEVLGVVLVQLTENRKLKFEILKGKTASQVNGFTNNFKIYER